MSDLPEVDSYPRWAVLVSAVVGLGVAVLLVWLASGFAVPSEQLFRVAPTVADGGVGADWATGNQIAWLDVLVAVTHAVDVIMGLFLLFLVFVHWASFRRLADRMRRSGEERSETAVADGGTETDGASDGGDAR